MKNTDKVKSNLFDSLLHDPLSFAKKGDINRLLARKVTFDEIRYLIRKIYDLNESRLVTLSNANAGITGVLNRHSTAHRYNKFIRKANKGPNEPVKIYAEGNSRSGRAENSNKIHD